MPSVTSASSTTTTTENEAVNQLRPPIRKFAARLMGVLLLCCWQLPALAGVVTVNELFSHFNDDDKSVKEHYLPKFTGPGGLLNAVSITFQSDFRGVLFLNGYKKTGLLNGPNATCDGPLGRPVDCHKVSQTAKVIANLGVELLQPIGSGFDFSENVVVKTDCQKTRIVKVPGNDVICTSTNAKDVSFVSTFNVDANDLVNYVSEGAFDRLKFSTSLVTDLICGNGVFGQSAGCLETTSFTGKISVSYSFGLDDGSNPSNPNPVPGPSTILVMLFGLMYTVARVRL